MPQLSTAHPSNIAANAGSASSTAPSTAPSARPSTPRTRHSTGGRSTSRRRTAAAFAASALGAALLMAGASPATAAPSTAPTAPAAPAALAAPAEYDWRVTDTIATPESMPRTVATAPDGENLFVGYSFSDTLSIVDLAGGPVVSRELDGWADPIITTPTLDGYRVLAADGNSIASVTPGSWSVMPASAPGVDAMAYSSFTDRVYSVDGGMQLSERDPVSGELLRWVELPLFSSAVVADPSRPVLYAVSESLHILLVIDLETIWDAWGDDLDTDEAWGDIAELTIEWDDLADLQAAWEEADSPEADWEGCGCDFPLGIVIFPGLTLSDLAVSLDGSEFYLLSAEGLVIAYDSAEIAATIGDILLPIGFNPLGVQLLDGEFLSPSLSVSLTTGELVAADFWGNRVMVMGPTELAITGEVPVGVSPWDTAFSPDGLRIYVTNQDDDTVSVLERAPYPPEPATHVTATPGARQAAVFWEASPSEAVQYTVHTLGSDEALCTTETTMCIVTGLTPGSTQFTVTATNVGGSAVSDASPAVMITAPAAPPVVPTPTPDVTVSFTGDSPYAAVIGTAAEVTVTGFAPGSFVDVSLHSLPALLGSAQVDSGGSATLAVTIPAGATPGTHHLVAAGFTPQGVAASAVSQVALTAAPVPPGPTPPTPPTPPAPTPDHGGHLPKTGADPQAALFATAGFLLAAGIAVFAVTGARSRRARELRLRTRS